MKPVGYASSNAAKEIESDQRIPLQTAKPSDDLLSSDF
jgi:hypothetical protein